MIRPNPMFVIAYIPSDVLVKLSADNDGQELTMTGANWKVDTDPETGQLVQIGDLEIALERVKFIRQKGGEACLLSVLE